MCAPLWAILKAKRTAYVIVTSRGRIVEHGALVAALRERSIAGAGLDTVFEEPLSADDPLWDLDNVLITPHMAYYSTHAVAESQRKAAAQVVKVLTGRQPDYRVN